MSEEEEAGFQVVDKRRVGREPAADARAGSQAGSAAGDQAQAVGGQDAAAEAESDAELGTPNRDVGTHGPAEAADTEFEERELEEEEEEIAGAVPTSVIDLAQMCLGMMNEVAWVKMGLVPDPITGAIGADLAEARLAIDCAADIVHRLEAHVDPRSHRDLQVLVQNLKMNFVKKSAGSG